MKGGFCKLAQMSRVESEVEDPPGLGRRSYSAETVPPTRWYDWHCQPVCRPINLYHAAPIIRLPSEALADLSAPGLLNWHPPFNQLARCAPTNPLLTVSNDRTRQEVRIVSWLYMCLYEPEGHREKKFSKRCCVV